MIADYINKTVEIQFKDGDTWTGKVVDYTIAGDNDPEEESIVLVPSNGPMNGENVEIFQHEISNIKMVK